MQKQRRITTDSLIESFLGFSGFTNSGPETSRSFPPHDIVEDTDGNISVIMALAGYPKDDISIEFDNNILTVSGKGTKYSDGTKIMRSGISYKDFSISWTISNHYEISTASMDNGLLSITLTKLQASRKKEIPIK